MDQATEDIWALLAPLTNWERTRGDNTRFDLEAMRRLLRRPGASPRVARLQIQVGGSKGKGNRCSNGGALGSIGVSWTIVNSRFAGNMATGRGANPPKSGLPGGGNGGAIYNDGNTMTLTVKGSRIVGNRSNGEGGSGIFFVSNDRSGDVRIANSVLRNNRGDGFKTHPGIFFLGRRISFVRTTIE